MSMLAAVQSSVSNSSVASKLKAGGLSAQVIDVVAKDVAELQKSGSGTGQTSLSSDTFR